MAKDLAFAIHHLNPWGGHDRSTLEIVKRISRALPIHIYTYEIVDLSPGANRDNIKTHLIRPHFRKPAIVLFSVFHLITYLLLKIFPKLTFKPAPLIHATGTCSLTSDVIQVQFVQTAWQHRLREIQSQSQPGIYKSPLSRSGNPLLIIARKIYHFLLLKYNIWIEKVVYKSNKTYIAIAKCVAIELETYFKIPKSNIHIVHHGVDLDHFCPPHSEKQIKERHDLRNNLKIQDDQIVVLFVGEYERKGLAVSMQALALLSENIQKKTILLAVGSGDVNGFKELANQLGLKKQVILLTHQKNVTQYYQASDLFLLPTLYEPFGLVILEAMSCGLPVIVSKLAGGAELIEDNLNGKLLDQPDNASEVAEKLETLILNKKNREKMGVEARNEALKHSWDQVTVEYLKILTPKMNETTDQ